MLWVRVLNELSAKQFRTQQWVLLIYLISLVVERLPFIRWIVLTVSSLVVVDGYRPLMMQTLQFGRDLWITLVVRCVVLMSEDSLCAKERQMVGMLEVV